MDSLFCLVFILDIVVVVANNGPILCTLKTDSTLLYNIVKIEKKCELFLHPDMLGTGFGRAKLIPGRRRSGKEYCEAAKTKT